MPGWPEFAFSTASIESVRIVLIESSSSSSCWSSFVPRSWCRARSIAVALDLQGREHARADHAGVRAALGERDGHALPERGQRPGPGLLDRAVEEQVRARERPPPIASRSGSKTFT